MKKVILFLGFFIVAANSKISATKSSTTPSIELPHDKRAEKTTACELLISFGFIADIAEKLEQFGAFEDCLNRGEAIKDRISTTIATKKANLNHPVIPKLRPSIFDSYYTSDDIEYCTREKIAFLEELLNRLGTASSKNDSTLKKKEPRFLTPQEISKIFL